MRAHTKPHCNPLSLRRKYSTTAIRSTTDKIDRKFELDKHATPQEQSLLPFFVTGG
jgi:hypothetical protein